MRRPLAAAVALAALAVVPACQKDEVVAPSLGVTCEARPGSGQAPLPVSFLLTVSGAAGTFDVSVSYGDGASGTSPDTPHTYVSAGTYVAAFTVTTATQSARCSATVTVAAAPPAPVNRPPDPVYKTTPEAVGTSQDKITGTAPLAVRFNLCASTDPDADLLWFSFDFDGDRHFDAEGTTGAYCRRDWTYTAGTWHPRVCVHDVTSSYEALHDDQCKSYTVTVTP
jgi:hypothetical protein